jgi:hypothetical protein
MSHECTPDNLHRTDERLHNQKQRFVGLLLDQLKSLFVVIVSTSVMLLLIYVETIYKSYLLLSFLIIMFVCDICITVLFILDMKRLINLGLAIYRDTHRIGSHRNSI